MKQVVVGALLFGSVVWGLACTKPNPRSCADGTCTDPALPFCDVDGSFSGTPDTCIAVSCTPDEHAGCRGDLAIRCNGTGTDYDLVECSTGCDAVLGCIGCTVDDECANPAPICEPSSNTCRACAADDECESTVCDRESGACVAAASILYASPTGSAVADCTQDEPCTLSRAVTVASTAGLSKLLRLLPGTYGDPLEVQGPASLRIVGTGAELGATSGMRVVGGATVEIRGLAIRSSTPSGSDVVCGDQNASIPKSSLTLRESIVAITGLMDRVRSFRCNLRIERSTSGPISFNTDSTFEADRVHFRHDRYVTITHFGERVSARITNSVFENVELSYSTSDTVAPGSQFFYAFNTFVFREGGQLCEPPGAGVIEDVRFENNIFFAAPTTNLPFVVRAPGCTFSNNLLFPQDTPVVNNMIADPLFVDFAGKDYHLQATSPAINTAVPSTGLSTTYDHDGVARPQGPAHDIGAFERVP